LSGDLRVCGVVPTYDNPLTVRAVVEALRAHVPEVVLVDDGSGPAGRKACDELSAEGLVHLVRLATNQGKGAAMRTGFRAAQALGYTHAMQVDADLQHDVRCLPAFLAAGATDPQALVLGYPVYDGSAPSSRRLARRITVFWVGLEIGSRARVIDAMIGFRLYPLAAALAVRSRCDRMGADIELVVRMVRAGTSVVNLPVGVRYVSAGEGGISHFRPVRDNLEFCVLHSRLCLEGILGWMRRAATGGGA
jgi:glycosyltransferase involved in cell wall biosynthesis